MVSQITTRMIPSVENRAADGSVEDIGMAPVVGVELVTADSSIPCSGLIDTAADLSVLDESLFQKLGHLTHFSSVRTVTTVGSVPHDLRLYLIDVRITGDSEGEALTFENVPAVVQPLHRPLFLIGRRGVLDRLRVELDFTRKRVILARPRDNLQKEFPNLVQEFSSLQSIIDALNEGRLESVVLWLFLEMEQFFDRLIAEDQELRTLGGPGLRKLGLVRKFQLIAERKNITDRMELARSFEELTKARNDVAHSANFKGLQRASVQELLNAVDRAVSRLRAVTITTSVQRWVAAVYVEARPKGRPEGSPIDDYVVEDHSQHVLGTFKTQAQAIAWAKSRGYVPHVARVRHLNNKMKPDHWRVA